MEKHNIKSYKILQLKEKQYSKFKLWICKLIKVIPARQYSLEIRLDLDFCSGICIFDIIQINNGMKLVVIDKCVEPIWITVVSEDMYDFDIERFKPTDLKVIGSVLEY